MSVPTGRRLLVGILLSAGSLCALASPGMAGVFPGTVWETRLPSEVGLDVAKLDELAAWVGGSGVIVRDGYLVYEWGNGGTTTEDWGSASKPLLSTLLFRADDLGLTTLETTMAEILGEASAMDSTITFHDLANMISSYSRGEDPGSAWAYNDYAINLYGNALFQNVYGLSPSSVFANELGLLQFEDPVQISSLQAGRIKIMSIRDFARLGLFWLNRGRWNGAQFIPDAYFDLITNQVPLALPRTTADGPESWDFGTFGGSDDQTAPVPGNYGMNFWVNTNGLWPDEPTNVLHANGNWGITSCFVLPDPGMVAVGIGTWGTPGDARSQLAVRLLRESATDGTVGVGESVRDETWSRIKSDYRVP